MDHKQLLKEVWRRDEGEEKEEVDDDDDLPMACIGRDGNIEVLRVEEPEQGLVTASAGMQRKEKRNEGHCDVVDDDDDNNHSDEKI